MTKKARRAARILAAVRRAGNDAEDLRDAAHEAHHAMDAGLAPGSWDRESIHKRLVGAPPHAVGRPKLTAANGGLYSLVHYPVLTRRSDLVSFEMDARAVEQIVCAELGVKIESIEHWAFIACTETQASFGIRFPIDKFVRGVELRFELGEMRKAAKRVLALGDA